MIRRLASHRHSRLALIATGCFIALAVAGAYRLGLDPATLASDAANFWTQQQSALDACVKSHPTLAPALLFGAIAILPTFILPVSPLLALCGALLGPVEGTFVAGLAMMTNACVTFALARKGRLWVEPKVLRAGYTIPRLTAENAGLALVPMRIIPGIPFVIQNYMLGLAGTPVKTFLFWIALIEIPCASPYVLVGAGAAGANGRLLLTGATLMLTAALLARILIRRRNLPAERTT